MLLRLPGTTGCDALLVNGSSKAGCALSERRLAYLSAVAHAKSIRGAADELNVESSVVSRQIQLLERELDTTLLDRHGRGVIATEAAQLVLEYHRRRLVDEAAMLSQLEALKSLERGNVNIAASEGFVEALVDTVLHDFSRKYPNITIELNVLPVSTIVRSIANEDIHIGLAFAPTRNKAVQIFARKRHPLFVIAHHDHPIARQNIIPDMAALAELSFCMVPEEFGIGQLTKMAERSAQVSLPRAMVTNSLQALRHFVTSGLGLTILPKILVERELKAGIVKAIKVKNVSFDAAEGQIIIPRRPTQSAAEQAMLQSLATMHWFT